MSDDKKQIVQPGPVSGFPEYLPEEQLQFNRLLKIIENGFRAFGFTPIVTPAAERIDILASKGEINKQIYGLYRPNVEDDEQETDMALHFDLTVPLARYVAQYLQQLDFPFRRYQIQKVWRGERPQKGRFREFYQCDIDVIGSEKLDPMYDAEMPAVIYRIFNEMNFGRFMIRMSNRKILQGFLESRGIHGGKIQDVLRSIDRLPKIGPEAVKKEMTGVPGLKPETVNEILSIADICGNGEKVMSHLEQFSTDNDTFQTGVNELGLLAKNLDALGVPSDAAEFDLSITRGLDYYTGTVYETFLLDYPALGSVCSGGRYDDLASHFINRKLPGVGISIGLTRLFSNLLEEGVIKPDRKSPTQVLVTVMDRERLSEYLRIATMLRKEGLSVEVYLEDRRLGKQFKYADKKGIPIALVAGENEFEKGVWRLKDLRAGEQVEVEEAGLVEVIEQLI